MRTGGRNGEAVLVGNILEVLAAGHRNGEPGLRVRQPEHGLERINTGDCPPLWIADEHQGGGERTTGIEGLAPHRRDDGGERTLDRPMKCDDAARL